MHCMLLADRVVCIRLQVVCELKKFAYPVTYDEFTGGHEVPQQIRSDTIQWYLGSYGATGTVPAGICSA